MSIYKDDIHSENEDDPDVQQSSGDEWDDTEVKKRGNRRTSQRLSKKPRVTHVEDSSDSEKEKSEVKVKSKNGVNKRQKIDDGSQVPPVINKITPKRTPVPGVNIPNADFINGGFLILKKDAQLGDPNKKPCLWRIDGKALLQKYEPFDDEGQVRHRNTSVYTGWSSLDKDLYSPVTVKVHQHQGQNMVVEINWEKLKEIVMDSD